MLNERIGEFLQLMLFGRILTDGRLNARVKCDLTENLILKANAQAIHMSNGFLLFIVYSHNGFLMSNAD